MRRGSPRQGYGKRVDPCGEIRATHRKAIIHQPDRSSSPSPSPSRQNLISATGDHHPAAQKNEIRNTQKTPVDTQDITELPGKRRAPSQNTTEPVPEQLEKRRAPSQNTTEPVPEQLEKRRAPSTVQFQPTIDHSDAGSLTMQAPHMNSVHATINALSAWISAVQPRESWYLTGWIEDSPIEFLVDPGAVVSALSLKCYESLVAAGSINTPLTELDLELEAANRSDMKMYGMCSFDLIVHGLSINMYTVVVDLNCQAILGMDILGDDTKPFSYIVFTQQQNALLKRWTL